MLWVVVLQDLQQEGSGLPHHVPLQEQVCNDVQLYWRPRLLGNHLRQVHCRVRAVHHGALQQVHVVRLVALQKWRMVTSSPPVFAR